ncbi:MAG: hypothetical protein PHR83_00580 [Paludibacter sp.]|nr:hypothetical protein [Paludibacter sp.]
MKKIYFIVSLAVTALLSGCQDYNASNFPGFGDDATPTNVLSMSYELTSTDYTAIATIIKKPVTDSITAQKALLAKAKTKADSTAIQSLITALNGRLTSVATYVNATKVDANKYFDGTLKAKDYLPYLLAQKYPYADPNSVIKVTYDQVNSADTSAVAAAYKFTISDAEYTQMGIATNQPGKSLCFSAVMPIMTYLNTYLKSKSPYAAANDVRMVRYKFSSSTGLSVQYRVLKFNGTDWKCTTDQYAFKKGKWLDVVILSGLTAGQGDFKAFSIVGDQVWAWNSYNYMLMTGYVAGSYFDNEDWLVSPAMNLTERVNPWLTFTHVGRYFGDTGTSTDKMHIAITLWVSTTSDGTGITPADWTQLTIPAAGYPSGANWTFISSTPIDLSAYAGKNNVRFAFKYLSNKSDNAAGSWEVKNVLVVEE